MRKFIPIGAVVAAVAVIIALTVVAPAITGGPQGRAADTPTYKVDGANGRVVNVDLEAFETVQEIAPGVKYHVWTFNGTAPAPVIRVHVGDTVHFTLTNASTIGMQHSIDFHAALTPWDVNYQPVDPGKSLSFDFVAMYPGAFLYHCGVPPVLQHIANGMYGAIIVVPDNLPQEREYVLVSSEFYPGAKPIGGVYEGDLSRMEAVDPQYVVFNGVADQYKDAPLEARPDEPFRIWLVNAGPTLTNAFHVIGTLFNETHDTGNPANTAYGLQTFNVPPGSGAMFELQIPDPGLYPFVTHAFAYTGLGAVGLVKVDENAPAAPDSYPTMGDPFSAGVAPSAPSDGPRPTPSASPSMDMPTPSASAAAAACSPKGTALQLVAHDTLFDTSCLAVPAGKPFTIAFDNQDPAIPHNVSIYTDEAATTALFTGDLVTGPKKITYKVPALDAGTYFFRCDVHPTTMTGAFVVR